MKNLLIILALILCFGCGKSVTDGVNGISGTNGADGADGEFTGEIEYIEVCPEIRPVAYPEVLLYLDGAYLGYFDAKDAGRLVVLKEGRRYITTDRRNVRFEIDDGEIVCY